MQALFKTLSLGALLICTQIANSTSYILPPEGNDIIGKLHYATIGKDTTLSDEARHFNVGFNEIRLANNGIDPWLPQNDSVIIIPTQHILPDIKREHMVINVPEMRMYYFPKAKEGELPTVKTYPISIGRGEWETPLGSTRIIAKTKDPNWYPPESIRKEHEEAGDPLPRVVPAGPDNPLGQYSLRLNIPGYLIHGTNKPYGIGMRVTHGCIRMYPEDIEAIFNQVSVNTKVKIIHQPYKFGRHLDWVYLEAHPMINPDGSYVINDTALKDAVTQYNATLPEGWEIDWSDAKRIADLKTGIPTIVKLKQVQQTPRLPDGQSGV